MELNKIMGIFFVDFCVFSSFLFLHKMSSDKVGRPIDYRLGTYQVLVANKRIQTEMWAFDLPLWAYVLVGFCPMGFCPTLQKTIPSAVVP